MKNQICFYCKVKKKKDFLVYIKKKKGSILGYKIKRPFLKEDSHSWDKFILNASHIKKKKRLQPNFQSLLLNFKSCNCVTKIRYVLNENAD